MEERLTDQGYWDEVWNSIGARAHANAPHVEPGRVTRWIESQCAAHLKAGHRFLEVGAGGSAWPAHVAGTLGAAAWGVDFSRPGLEQAGSACAPGPKVLLVGGGFFDRSRLPPGAFGALYSGRLIGA